MSTPRDGRSSSSRTASTSTRRGIKLRSTHSASSGRYRALNVGDGSYTYKDKLVTISKKDSLKGRIDDWFARRAGATHALPARS